MTSPATRLEPASGSGGAVLIPVKDFGQAKGRLSETLGASKRALLAEEMAARLVRVQRNVTVAICCDDGGVADWAADVGAAMIWCPGTDLNGAVQQGVSELAAAGYQSVAVAHSDLPLAGSLDNLLGWPGVTIVPDRHRTGSNVIALPTALNFRFSYGTNSFQRHVSQAVHLQCGVRIVHDRRLGWDVDQPDDLDTPESTFLSDLLDRSS